ncbi:MAG: cell division topological specificity factor MinE [Anaerolineales bacterium]|nr:cell division topological specificity factor MinE [Anaerolineales bacterium]HEY61211.1 cell division topological specificity factor MinE [Anaerolineae bacterium]
MTNLISRLFKNNPRSGKVAKERLQMVLIHDRTNFTNNMLELLKDDLIATISRHIDIDPSSVKIEMNSTGRQQRLIADIPLKQSKRKLR